MAKEQELPGKVRKPRPGEVVATRVALAGLEKPAYRDGVQPLNPGVLQLNALRAGPAVKIKEKQRTVLRSN